jgi:predicted NBD/HSP70 family sugar kinase
MTTAYLGLDLHANSCTLGVMDEDGTFQGHQKFPTKANAFARGRADSSRLLDRGRHKAVGA